MTLVPIPAAEPLVMVITINRRPDACESATGIEPANEIMQASYQRKGEKEKELHRCSFTQPCAVMWPLKTNNVTRSNPDLLRAAVHFDLVFTVRLVYFNCRVRE